MALEQKITCPISEFDNLKKGDKVRFNYRVCTEIGYRNGNLGCRLRYEQRYYKVEAEIISIRDKSIYVSIPTISEGIDIKTNKIIVDNTPTKATYLKSTIASIEKVN